MREKTRNQIVGKLLIGLGLMLFLTRILSGYGESITLFTLSSGFIAAYLVWQSYPMLVIGGIMLGTATSSLADSWNVTGLDVGQIALGCGFIGIYAVDRLFRRNSPIWPLIPGIILVIVGITAETHWLQRGLSFGWPLALVVWGFWMLSKRPRLDKDEPKAG